jgi:hypothetical protein
MVSSSILGLFAVASAGLIPPSTDVGLDFVDCYNQKRCHFKDYYGEWEVENIGSLQSQCGKLSYRVKPYQNVLQFFETCSKSREQTLLMLGYRGTRFGFIDFQTAPHPAPPIVLPGMVYYWKKGEVVVAGFIRHPVRHGTLPDSIRPLWLKKELLSDLEIQRIQLAHSMRS